MKFICCFALATTLFASLAGAASSSSDLKKQKSDELIGRANGSTPAAIKGPYRVQYKLIVHGAGKEPIEGTYISTWVSKNKWRHEISMPGYSEVSVADGQALWIDRKPHLYQPESMARLNYAIDVTNEPKLGYYEEVSKVKEETHDGTRMQCIEMKHGKALCFDEATGALVRVQGSAQQRVEISDYNNFIGALIPRRVRNFDGKDLDAEAVLVSLRSLNTPDAGLFSHSSDSRQFGICDAASLTPAKLITSPAPDYPGQDRTSGSVSIYVVVDVDGTPKDLEIVRGATPALNNAALAAVRQWRFGPFQCDGSPIRRETMIVVDFKL
jgi:TonB family protein